MRTGVSTSTHHITSECGVSLWRDDVVLNEGGGRFALRSEAATSAGSFAMWVATVQVSSSSLLLSGLELSDANVYEP